MPYFKDTNNKLHFLDDDSHTHLLPSDCVEITDEEAATLSQPAPLSVVERKAIKQREIDVLETDDKCGRRYREGFLLSCIKEASALGLTEEQAYAANPGYRGAKDLNTKITTLRAEIRAIV